MDFLLGLEGGSHNFVFNIKQYENYIKYFNSTNIPERLIFTLISIFRTFDIWYKCGWCGGKCQSKFRVKKSNLASKYIMDI